MKYNEEKEEKAKQEKKQRQLEALELARKLEEEKKKNGTYFLKWGQTKLNILSVKKCRENLMSCTSVETVINIDRKHVTFM